MPSSRFQAAALLTIIVANVLGVGGAPKWSASADEGDAASSAGGLTKEDKGELWKAWKSKQGRAYSQQQDDRRFAAFSANLDDVVAHNSQPGMRFSKGLNAFSDLSPAEFEGEDDDGDKGDASRRRLQKKTFTSAATATPANTATSIPKAFDWRAKSGVVPPVRDQQGCGACWAFASLGAVEMAARIAGLFTTAINLSEQQLVDCANAQYSANYWSMGCTGGYIVDPLKYMAAAFDAPESYYRYRATTGATCGAPAKPPSASVALPSPGYASVAANATDIMRVVSTVGPVAVYMYASPDFKAYSGGIFPASACVATGINHAVAIVGYNATLGPSSPNSYWVVRNSWGLSWGEGGYARIQMTDDAAGPCLMYGGALIPLKPKLATSTTTTAKAGR